MPPDPVYRRLPATVLFGFALPLGCFVFDPIVFRWSETFDGGPWLGGARPLCYTAAGLGMASLAGWLALRRCPGLTAGLLAGAALFALGLGVVLSPLSLIGLLVCVGVFGLVPFGTAWVFARQAWLAWERAAGLAWPLLGLVLATGGPGVLQVGAEVAVRSATADALSADPATAERGADRLARLGFATDPDELVWAYSRDRDPDRKRRLADAYRRVTGGDIERRLDVLRD